MLRVPDKKKTETSSLLNRPSLLPNGFFSTAAKLGLGVLGLGATGLYITPAKQCAETIECGLFLSNWITPLGSRIVFTAGGLDFSAGAMYMGAQSAEATIQYIRYEESTNSFTEMIKGDEDGNNVSSACCAIVTKATGLTFVVLTQNISLALLSLSTSEAAWESILTITGAFPGSVYGSVNLIKREIPYFIAKTKDYIAQFHGAIVDCCYTLSESEKQIRSLEKHYQFEHKKFIERVNTRWRHVVVQARDLDDENSDIKTTPLDFIFGTITNSLFSEGTSTNSHLSNESWPSYLIHHLGSAIGFGLALDFSAAILKTTMSMLTFIPTLPLQGLTSVFLNSALLYGNIRLTIDGMHALLDTLVDILECKPIRSTLFQLRPATTYFVAAGSIGLSVFSYAVVAIVFLNQFGEKPSGGKAKLDDTGLGFLYSAMAGINVYHFASLLHLFRITFESLLATDKEKFIFKVEKVVEAINRMSVAQFKDLTTQLDANTVARYGISETQEGNDEGSEEEDVTEISAHDIRKAEDRDTAPGWSQFCSTLFSKCLRWNWNASSVNRVESEHLTPRSSVNSQQDR